MVRLPCCACPPGGSTSFQHCPASQFLSLFYIHPTPSPKPITREPSSMLHQASTSQPAPSAALLLLHARPTRPVQGTMACPDAHHCIPCASLRAAALQFVTQSRSCSFPACCIAAQLDMSGPEGRLPAPPAHLLPPSVLGQLGPAGMNPQAVEQPITRLHAPSSSSPVPPSNSIDAGPQLLLGGLVCAHLANGWHQPWCSPSAQCAAGGPPAVATAAADQRLNQGLAQARASF